MSFLRELLSFLKARKKYWLAPVFIFSALLGGLVIFTQGSAVTPFIYAVF